MNRCYHLDFEDLPANAWQLLLDRALVNASHLEVSRTFSNAPFSAAFATAEVPLPHNIDRVYVATNRFVLTSEVIAEVKGKRYQDWNSYDAEDPALYQETVMLLGTISHEDCVYMQLNEKDRAELNSQGFDFRIE